MTYQDFLQAVDDSHPMTTGREHIAVLCRLIAGRSWRVLELGSHAGISTAAMAMAAPESTIVSVDLCDTVPQHVRAGYWHLLGLDNIQAIHASAGWFLRESQLHLQAWDLIFHDAVHGEAAVPEYLTAAWITDRLAIHDWEQLSAASQANISCQFEHVTVSADANGRVLFVGWR